MNSSDNFVMTDKQWEIFDIVGSDLFEKIGYAPNRYLQVLELSGLTPLQSVTVLSFHLVSLARKYVNYFYEQEGVTPDLERWLKHCEWVFVECLDGESDLSNGGDDE